MMRIICLALVSLFMISCSTTKKSSEVDLDKVSNEAFKKDKPLLFGKSNDYYAGSMAVENPALQDETIDRLSSDELSKIDPKGDELLGLAIRCAQGDDKNAAKLIDDLYQKYQNFPSYWTQVANCYLKQNQNRKALLFYNKALELSSSYAPALNNIGILYYREGQTQKALVAFEKANAKARFAKTPRLNLAKLYLSYGLADHARPIISGLANQTPNDSDLIVTLANVSFVKGDYQEALKQFFRLDQKLWSQADIGLNVSYALFKIGKQKDASNVLSRISKPKNSLLSNYYEEVRNIVGE